MFPCKDVSTTTVIKCLCQLFSLFGMPAYIHSDRGSSFMSEELRQFLMSRGVATSRTTPYNPACNGQVERYNGTIWKTIRMALETGGLPVTHWQDVLPDALHSIISLLCTATNNTPHERFFRFERRSSTGGSVPTWLSTPGPVLLKRHVRANKTDPLVDEVQLLQANPQYAHIRHADGRETTVSIRHLAPCGNTNETPVQSSSSETAVVPTGQQAEPVAPTKRILLNIPQRILLLPMMSCHLKIVLLQLTLPQLLPPQVNPKYCDVLSARDTHLTTTTRLLPKLLKVRGE